MHHRAAAEIISRGLRGGAVRASACGDPSRFETVEYSRQERWLSAAARFRHREANRKSRDARRADARWTAADDAGLRVAGAIPRRARGDPRGRLFARRDSLRIARGTAPIRLFESLGGGDGENYRR